MLFKKKQKNQAVNEFNQVVEGNSLSKDAWRRLKKNRMAVIGMILVIVYGLVALCAPILPIYPYDEIILDHQNLPPSLTKTAGELMLKNKLQTVYFDEWKSGNLKVTPEQDEQIKAWIKNNEAGKVWDVLYTEGEQQRAAGTFTFSKKNQKTYDRLLKKIDTDLLVTVKKAYYVDDNGKQTNLKSLNSDQLADLYSSMLGVDKALIVDGTKTEVENQVLTDIKSRDSEMTDEQAQSNLALELKSMGDKGFESRMKDSLYGKIINEGTNKIQRDLKKDAEEGSVTFPFNATRQVGDHLTLKVKATKMHERRYLLGTDYVGRDLMSRVIYGGDRKSVV